MINAALSIFRKISSDTKIDGAKNKSRNNGRDDEKANLQSWL